MKRKDHLLKIAAYLILSIYWFHPLVWASYFLLGRDIELACDEKAASQMNQQERKNYLLALLNCSTAGRSAHVHPLAFGEIGLKERVERMKRWRKPPVWLRIVSLLFIIAISAVFLTMPRAQEMGGTGKTPPAASTAQAPGAGEMGRTGERMLEVRPASVNPDDTTGAAAAAEKKKQKFAVSLGTYDTLSSEIPGCPIRIENIGQQEGDVEFFIAVSKGRLLQWDQKTGVTKNRGNSGKFKENKKIFWSPLNRGELVKQAKAEIKIFVKGKLREAVDIKFARRRNGSYVAKRIKEK